MKKLVHSKSKNKTVASVNPDYIGVNHEPRTINQHGQVVIVLTLIMLVALTVGVAISQRSINDISVSTKTEQASRAFSAAEAGLEKAIAENGITTVSLSDNQSRADVQASGEMPVYKQALEYPPISKAQFAQFWLARPSDLSRFYNQETISLYFGNAGPEADDRVEIGDEPAIEVNLVTRSSAGNYLSKRYYFDSKSTRRASNNFAATDDSCDSSIKYKINTSSSRSFTAPPDRYFYCKVTISTSIDPSDNKEVPILMRMRLLYSSKKQRIALEPKTDPECISFTGDLNCISLPPQANIYTSTGIAGESERRLQVFQMKYVAPQFLDFALFSNSDITK
ncbi:hypothetical protein A3E86_02800 [Candidatus Daviesbacteria bacterium RIFCSPHIGHO2_12_FULL_47_45]|nr:MAG: hypothetical protein A3E86_02800 [Candidatus Daviesbacteria bacterium RIFCSPHIGHO2_12_FULL_47_45]